MLEMTLEASLTVHYTVLVAKIPEFHILLLAVVVDAGRADCGRDHQKQVSQAVVDFQL